MINAKVTARRRGSTLSLVLVLLVLLTTSLAEAQPRPTTTAGNPAASAAEVTAFMQAYARDPKASLKIGALPNRVPLLLGAMKRDPKGPWASELQGCWLAERQLAFRLPPANRGPFYRRAIEYLTAAKTTAAEAVAADPKDKQLKFNLDRLERTLALADRELDYAINQANLQENKAATNAPTDAPEAAAPKKPKTPTEICANRLRQIDLAKQMWMTDNKKPQDATPTAADLVYYFPPEHKLPQCPEGGTYTLGRLNQKPTCSARGHVLPSGAK